MDGRYHSDRRLTASLRGAAVVALCLAGVACGTRQQTLSPLAADADQFLYEQGTEALQEGRWQDARDYFVRLIDGYPGSQYRADAKLGLGDVYLGQGGADSLVFAQNEFREFLSFYPTSRRADYAQYKLGMTHYLAMRGPGRDQTETNLAIREFEAFRQRYPASALRDEVDLRLREAKDRWGDHEFGVGLTYYRLRVYRSALGRFLGILENDPQYTNRDRVYFHLAEIYRRADNFDEALSYYQRLVDEFARSEHLDDARKRIGELTPVVARRAESSVSE